MSTNIFSLSNIIFKKEEIEISPSIKDGIPKETEIKLRVYGSELIANSGILLKLPQATIATGQVLLHRFYYLRSFKEFNVKSVAISCLFLATKLEESPKRMRDIINVYNHIQQVENKEKIEALDYNQQAYWDYKNEVMKTERVILLEMGFNLFVELPHKYLVNYLKVLNFEKNINFIQTAWNYANDSLKSDVCCRFTPEVIASACIYMTAILMQICLPEDPPWWELFDAKKYEMDDIANCITQLYKLPKAIYISVISPDPHDRSNEIKHIQENEDNRNTKSKSSSSSRERKPETKKKSKSPRSKRHKSPIKKRSRKHDSESPERKRKRKN